MASVVLADIVQRPQYAREVLHASLRKSVLFQSAVIQGDAELRSMLLANVGNTFRFDYFNDLADTVARVGDDSATAAVPDNITAQSDNAIGCLRNYAWGEKNIVSNLSSAGSPIMAIAGRVGAYWGRQMDFVTLSIVTGILADNVANDASDMVNDQNQVAVTVQMILETKQTAGDMRDMFTTFICHSAIATKLQVDGVTNAVYSDDGTYLYETLAGLRIVETDSVPLVAGIKQDYTSYITGSGVVGYGEGVAKRANAVEYNEALGNGQGEEALWSRKNFSLHPYGFDFLSASMASTSPTNVEFENALNWSRNVERKRVKIASLICSAT